MASGDTLAYFPASAGIPTPTNGATIDTRNNHIVYDFDDTTNEYLIFEGYMPSSYDDTSNIVVIIYFSATSATSGDVLWNVQAENGSGLDIDADSFASAVNPGTKTVKATLGETASVSPILTRAQFDSIIAGEMFRLKISRDASNASDTATGDMELQAVVVQQL